MACALGLIAVTSTARAQTPPPPEIRAVRASTPIAIDGALSEDAWKSAEVIGDFRQRDPNEGAPASQRTEVRVLFDDQNLYVGARLYDSHADSIVAQLTRRDAGTRTDMFRVYLDPYFDRRSGYYFSVNAAGTLFDGTLYNDGWSDNSWDGVWEARARVDPQGWTAELKIPFSQLRFSRAAAARWGINFQRALGRGFEDDYLVYQPRKESGFVSRFPALVGLDNVSPGGAIEMLPYATHKLEMLQHAPLDPFHDGSQMKPNLGGDLRMPIGSKLTLNATVNPDFGQVEVDPAVVNLSDVETFFPEKRPFFVEGSSIFNAGQQGASDYWGFNWSQPTFFYSRRIGRAPAGRLPFDTRYRDVPNGTTILGATKLSGKPSPSLQLGWLNAVTSREQADLVRASAGRLDGYDVEPLTYYGVGRVLKEFPERRHGLGAITTVTARQFDDARLENEFNRSALLGAIDGWHFLDRNKVWVLSGWAGGTFVRGSQTQIANLQTNPRHYFQRPDAKSFSFDPNATTLAGTGGRVWLNKEKGNWISNSAIGFLSPGFENNDLGFFNRADVVNAHVGAGYKWTQPTRYVKNHNVLVSAFGSTDFDGNLTNAGLWSSAFWWYDNNWTLQPRVAFNPEVVNPRRSRGGPLMLSRRGYETSLFFDTDGSSHARYYNAFFYSYAQPEENSFNRSAEAYVSYKVRSNLSFSIGPSFEVARDGAFFVAAVDDPAATATFGRRYVFAQLDQRTLAANLRLAVSFTPAMSLEFFGQPLIATGEFTNLRELARPKSLDFIGPGAGAWTYDPATHSFDPDGAGPEAAQRSDFNFKSLRGNAIYRWEYSPGSTLYLVWTHERTDRESDAAFEVGPSMRRLLRADADNIFLAKVTWYLHL
jgi:hypothetical protein